MSTSLNSTTFEVITSRKFASEKKYILTVFVEEYLGGKLLLKFSDKSTEYKVSNNNQSICLPDIFFGQDYYTNKTHLDVQLIEFRNETLPAWFYSDIENDHSQVDIFGMAFFLLSGFSDIHFSEKDKFERNIGQTSFLAQNQLIDRPIIQEWFLLLAKQLLSDDQIADLSLLDSRKHVSHDVDQPFEYLNYTPQRLFKRVMGDLLIRKDFHLAKNRIKYFRKVRNGDYAIDPYNNFHSLLDLLKNYDITSTFFFVASDNEHPNDVGYSIEQDAIKQTLTKVDQAGHTIGLHPSFYTLRNENILRTEVNRLQSVLSEIGINKNINQCRKHYLRWDWETTPAELTVAGFSDDYTVGYADRTGFRVGVAFPYSAFDWNSKHALTLKLHPLIVMECSLTSAGYMGLSYENSRKFINEYHSIIEKYGGEFVLLWHNHLLLKNEDKELFEHFLGL